MGGNSKRTTAGGKGNSENMGVPKAHKGLTKFQQAQLDYAK